MGEKNVSMAVDLGGVRMQNPVNTASGTFAFGSVFEDFFDVSAWARSRSRAAPPSPGTATPRRACARCRAA